MNLGFLASGRGSNLQAVIDACKSGRLLATPRVVISNNSASGALERARREGIPAYHLSSHTHGEGLDEAILQTLQRHEVELVVLVGYMKKLGPRTLAAYRNRIVNIHPALLPKFGGQGMYGMNVHKAVIEAGERESGATIHLVDEEYDHGAILAQTRVPVLPDDTPQTLAQRVLEREHAFLVETLGKIISGEIRLD
ncbi:phosphoribosylglycinamide formyltransferase [Calidithermus roseus]|uniref:Phosphoribosylglycinamide formyltransferase n=1 Tax=Calidithermus roseus TaxID=1644118 RepID=A0A399EUL5_9DEIN|nr:phosphoribosylglycinamide formyltransferase [Calidithermus roseus]RIH86302.1 Phosphoribosylglycinamide formyltransferase [Calidithermus roseus]